jgi:hypothetical protein
LKQPEVDTMRTAIAMLPLLIAAAPAAAQPMPVAAPPPPAEQQIERALNDPVMVDRMTHTMDALSKAFLNVRVGEVEAALEGRDATPAERRRTVRDLARRDGIDVQRQIAQARPMIQQSMRAMAGALPQMMQGLQQAQEALDRAAANMPDPNYPKR